jgi:type IV fimbrial biogenesis protein FimT
MRARAERGFTLVEVMIVIAVIGIMTGLMAPSLLGALPGMRASGAARDVLSDMRLARTMAVDKGVPAIVDFDAPASTHYRVYLDRDGDGTYTTGTDTMIREVTLTDEYKGVALKSNDGSAPADGVDLDGVGSNSITFRTNGSANGSGAAYVMPAADAGGRSDRNRRVRVVAATGNVRIENFDGSNWE